MLAGDKVVSNRSVAFPFDRRTSGRYMDKVDSVGLKLCLLLDV